MLNNYRYYLVFAEELNITRAAARLFVSHQSLSSYLKKLEDHYGVSLFTRKPQMALTANGKLLLEAYRDIQRIEMNLEGRLSDVREEQAGEIRFGTTKGRFRILMPILLSEFSKSHPNVTIRAYDDLSTRTGQMLINNEIDLFLGGIGHTSSHRLQSKLMLEESLYLVVSDHVLQQHFQGPLAAVKQRLSSGVDLMEFSDIPFVVNRRGIPSRSIIDRHLSAIGVSLRMLDDFTQPEMHHVLASIGYGATFCLTMYLPDIREINRSEKGNGRSHLNVYPLMGLTEKSQLMLTSRKDSVFPRYTRDFIEQVRSVCDGFRAYEGKYIRT